MGTHRTRSPHAFLSSVLNQLTEPFSRLPSDDGPDLSHKADTSPTGLDAPPNFPVIRFKPASAELVSNKEAANPKAQCKN